MLMTYWQRGKSDGTSRGGQMKLNTRLMNTKFSMNDVSMYNKNSGSRISSAKLKSFLCVHPQCLGCSEGSLWWGWLGCWLVRMSYLVSPAFQKYSICWVFKALCLCLCLQVDSVCHEPKAISAYIHVKQGCLYTLTHSSWSFFYRLCLCLFLSTV